MFMVLVLVVVADGAKAVTLMLWAIKRMMILVVFMIECELVR